MKVGLQPGMVSHMVVLNFQTKRMVIMGHLLSCTVMMDSPIRPDALPTPHFLIVSPQVIVR